MHAAVEAFKLNLLTAADGVTGSCGFSSVLSAVVAVGITRAYKVLMNHSTT